MAKSGTFILMIQDDVDHFMNASHLCGNLISNIINHLVSIIQICHNGATHVYDHDNVIFKQYIISKMRVALDELL
jgi:hypothetical protein